MVLPVKSYLDSLEEGGSDIKNISQFHEFLNDQLMVWDWFKSDLFKEGELERLAIIIQKNIENLVEVTNSIKPVFEGDQRDIMFKNIESFEAETSKANSRPPFNVDYKVRTDVLDLKEKSGPEIAGYYLMCALGMLDKFQFESVHNPYKVIAVNQWYLYSEQGPALDAIYLKIKLVEKHYNRILKSTNEAYEPLKFWNDKKNELAGEKREYLLYLVCSAIVFALVLFASSFYIIDKPILEIQLYKIFIIMGVTSIAIWILRILGKLYISSINLHEDARQRLVAINTYLSLLSKHESIKEHQEYFFKELFRGNGDRISSDKDYQASSMQLINNIKETIPNGKIP